MPCEESSFKEDSRIPKPESEEYSPDSRFSGVKNINLKLRLSDQPLFSSLK